MRMFQFLMKVEFPRAIVFRGIIRTPPKDSGQERMRPEQMKQRTKGFTLKKRNSRLQLVGTSGDSGANGA